MRTIVPAIAAAVMLTACAAPRPTYYVKDGAADGELLQALAQCDYETSAATQGTDYSLRSTFGQEFDRALRKRQLTEKCMAARGWRRQ